MAAAKDATSTATAAPTSEGSATGPTEGVRILREKGRVTRMLVLRLLETEPLATQRRLAERLGITGQAVSEHVRRLVADDLVAATDDGYLLTPVGREHLYDELRTIKGYVDDALREATYIERTGAVAGAPIGAGDAVGLVMEHGRLTAYPGRASSSTGVACSEAAAGQDVAVRGLEGIVELERGRVVFGIVPDAIEGGSRRLDRGTLGKLVKAAGLVVAQGPVARYVLDEVGVGAVTWGVAEAAAEAAMRGVDVVLLVERWESEETRRRFEQATHRWGVQVDATTVVLIGR